MDPRHRTLRKVTMRDLEAAERTFELLMGNDVAPRKDFIIGSAAEVDRSASTPDRPLTQAVMILDDRADAAPSVGVA